MTTTDTQETTMPVTASAPAVAAHKAAKAYALLLEDAAKAAGLPDVHTHVTPSHRVALVLTGPASLALLALLDSSATHGCATAGGCTLETVEGLSVPAGDLEPRLTRRVPWESDVPEGEDLGDWAISVARQALLDLRTSLEGVDPTPFEVTVLWALEAAADSPLALDAIDPEAEVRPGIPWADVVQGVRDRMDWAAHNLRQAEPAARRLPPRPRPDAIPWGSDLVREVYADPEMDDLGHEFRP